MNEKRSPALRKVRAGLLLTAPDGFGNPSAEAADLTIRRERFPLNPETKMRKMKSGLEGSGPDFFDFLARDIDRR